MKIYERLGLPQIILGDFNNDYETYKTEFKILTNYGLKLISSTKKTAFNQDPRGATIDQIYASEKLVKIFNVKKTDVVQSIESDHYPIFVDLELKKSKKEQLPAPATPPFLYHQHQQRFKPPLPPIPIRDQIRNLLYTSVINLVDVIFSNTFGHK